MFRLNKVLAILFVIVLRCAAGVDTTPIFSDTLEVTFVQINDSTYAQVRTINNSKQETLFDAAGLCEYLNEEQAVVDEYLARVEEEYKQAKKESDRVKKWISDIEKGFNIKCKKVEGQE